MQMVADPRSIIFTCWTRTLDLIQIHLKTSGFAPQNFKRIDGDCPTSRRERILEDFASDDNLRVLIMTTGTGAVGQVSVRWRQFEHCIDIRTGSTSLWQTGYSSWSRSGILLSRIKLLLVPFVSVRSNPYW